MRTRIFWNHQTGEKHCLTQDEFLELRAERASRKDGAYFMPDISGAYKDGGFVSPVDGSFITSRDQLRRHNNTHQCRQGGDFRPGDLVTKERSRVERNRQLVANEKVRFEWQ